MSDALTKNRYVVENRATGGTRGFPSREAADAEIARINARGQDAQLRQHRLILEDVLWSPAKPLR